MLIVKQIGANQTIQSKRELKGMYLPPSKNERLPHAAEDLFLRRQ